MNAHPRAATALRIAAAVSVAVILASLVFAALPRSLDVHTDVVGYPTFANFDIDPYLWGYGLTVVFVPLAAVILYLGLTRLLVGPIGPWRPLPRPLARIEDIPPAVGWRAWAVGGGRVFFVGFAVGIELAIIERASAIVALLTAVSYLGVVVVVASLAARHGRRDPFVVAGSVNTLVAPVAVAGLYGVSRSTEVAVSATGVVHHYPWLPAWVALGLALGLVVFFGYRLRRMLDPRGLNRLERSALLLVVAPVCVFLLTSELPGALPGFDAFEEGQTVAGAALTRGGAFPWRDLLVTHGWLFDIGRGLIGFHFFEDSRWGSVAGNDVLVGPLACVALYYLCAYLFWTNWLYLFVTQVAVVAGHWVPNARFLLLPLVLLLLAALLAKPTAARAAAFTSLLAVQVIVTPEALAAAVAYLGTLVLFELYYYERGSVLALGFRRVWLCAATALVLAVAWAAFLAANHALDDWIFSFTALIPAHGLTGSIPLHVSHTDTKVVGPIVIVLAVLAFFATRTILRRPLSYGDWLMVAMVGMTLLYFTKFLYRANPYHLQQAYSVAVPLILYMGFRGVTFGEGALARVAGSRADSRLPARHVLTGLLLLLVLVGTTSTLRDTTTTLGTRFAPVVPTEPELERLGYAQPGENDVEMVRDVERATTSLLASGETMFDFTNSPGLFYYLYDLPPASRYYHVSLAIRQRTQSDLVKRLEKTQPKVVAFTSGTVGGSLPSWDGISNQVRHYDVSSYLLDRYVPVLESHGFVLMVRRGPGVKADRHLYFSAPECDWGYVPNFFAPSPSPTARATQLAVRRGGNGKRYSVTLPADASSYDWLELKTEGPLPASRFTLSDRAGASTGHAIAFRSLARGENVIRVKVGACSQWHGYRPGVVRLTSSVPLDAVQVRVVR